jgi:hypothetical protein
MVREGQLERWCDDVFDARMRGNCVCVCVCVGEGGGLGLLEGQFGGRAGSYMCLLGKGQAAVVSEVKAVMMMSAEKAVVQKQGQGTDKEHSAGGLGAKGSRAGATGSYGNWTIGGFGNMRNLRKRLQGD